MKSWKTLLLSIIIVTNVVLAEPQLIDKIIAVVNNDVILENDIDNLMQSIKLSISEDGHRISNNDALRHQILEHMILDQIVLQIGQKMGVKITNNQLDQALVNIAKQNNMTTDQMRNYLAYNGISYSNYRGQVHKEMIISEVRNNEVRRRINIMPQEVDELAEQVDNQNDDNTELKLSHILISLPENTTFNQATEVEIRARSIINQMCSDENFSKLMIIDQQEIKVRDMGWVSIQKLPFIFAQALSTAKKGDIIGPIRSGVGFHILKVDDLRNREQNIFVTEVHARHIMLKPSPIMNDGQAREKLQQIAADIKSGKTSFANAAKEFSRDLNSANRGGDLGWSTIDIYDPYFRNALMKLNKGQMSDPVHSSFGWHLIELLDIRNTDKTNVVKKDRAYQMLFNHKFSEEAAEWIREQHANAYIKVLNN